ncbi:MAG TPA: TIGR04211 family SH3 domain-containing protein [Gammaproteobacteria bacterium]|nr:TIGR04211 family SH3 domain-containing protein [Gammaproteobacteria bacterium]
MDRAACWATSLFLLMSGMLSANVAWADDMYVTDQLLVGIYTDRSLTGPPVKLLKSGTQLEVVQRDGQVVEVKTSDNNQGWLKASYLTLEPPAQAQLAKQKQKIGQLNSRIKRQWTKAANAENNLKKIEAENLKTKQQLERLTKQSASGKNQSVELQQQLQQLQNERKEQDNQLKLLGDERDSLTSSNSELSATLESLQGTGRWKWFTAAFAVTFVIGLVAGIALLDKRQRKRHGGFRI